MAHARGTLIWTSTSYDANDNVISQSAPAYGTPSYVAGAKTSFEYGLMDRLLVATGPDRRDKDGDGVVELERTRLTYDVAGRLQKVTRPKGVPQGSWSNDPVPNDYSTVYGYDELDRVVTETTYPADGASSGARTTRYCYDVAGDLRAVTSPRGNASFTSCSAESDFTQTFDYDAAHRLVVETTAKTGEAGNRTRHQRNYGYDGNGNATSFTNENGVTTTRTYDQRDLLVKVVTPFERGARTRDVTAKLEYDPVGNLKRRISPRAWDASSDKATFNDYVTSYEYDAVDQLVRVNLPTASGSQKAYVHRAYDPNGNLVSTSLPVDTTDATAVPARAKTAVGYYDPGWIRTSKDPAERAVFFDYTAEGRQRCRVPVQTTCPASTPHAEQTDWTYYDDGLVAKVLGEKVSPRTTREETRYEYDANGNLAEAVDDSGSTRQIAVEIRASWNGFDELAEVRERKQNDSNDQNWRITTSSYDVNGNVVERIDGKEEAPDGTLARAGRRHAFTYDPADWLLTQTDYGKSGTGCSDDRRITNDFWPTGWEKERVVYETASGCTDTSPDWQKRQRTAKTYWENGKLKTLQTTRYDPSSGAATLVEDHDISYEAGGIYVNGHRTVDDFKRAAAEGTSGRCEVRCLQTYKYDPRDRLSEERLALAGPPESEIRKTLYTLDAAEPGVDVLTGNVRREEVYRNGATSATTTRRFSYEGDKLSALTAAGETQRYLYDLRGRLDCVTSDRFGGETCASAPADTLLADYEYDHLDRLTKLRSFLITETTNPDGTKSYTWKAKDTSEYLYDALDRLVEEREGHPGDRDWDADGEQVWRKTLFTHLGLSARVVGEEQRRYTGASPDFSLAGELVTTKSYSYDAFGERVALANAPRGKPEQRYSYAYDPHGSASLLVAETGTAGKVQASYGYLPYGERDPELTRELDPGKEEALAGTCASEPARCETSETSPLNAYRYTGKRLDSGSGTYDMGARRFSADTGRFLEPDLYEGALADLALALDPLTQNRYALAGGNPVSFVETDGHAPMADHGGAGGGAASPNPGRSSPGDHTVSEAASGSYGESEGPADDYSSDAVRKAGQQAPQSDAAAYLGAGDYQNCGTPSGFAVPCEYVRFQARPVCEGQQLDCALYTLDALTFWAGGPKLTVARHGAEMLARLGVRTYRWLVRGNRAARAGAGGARALPTGLRDASPGLKQLFAEGSIRDRSIMGIRSTLREHGFAPQTLTRNRHGYLFEGPAGEQVRIMRRGGGWDVRVQNRFGNYLDEYGNVASPSETHGITLWSR